MIREHSERPTARDFCGREQLDGERSRTLASALLLARKGHPVSAWRVPVSPGAREAMGHIASGSELSAFTVLVATTGLLLRRYTGTPFVSVDVPVLGSRHPAGAVGDTHDAFGRALPLTVDLREIATFKDLLLLYRDAMTAKLQREAAFVASHGARQNGMADVDVLVDAPRLFGAHSRALRYNLVVSLVCFDTYALAVSSPSGRLPPWLLAQLGEDLQNALSALESPSQSVDIFDSAVSNRALSTVTAFNRTDRTFANLRRNPGVGRPATVMDVVSAQTSITGAACAIVCGERRLSYATLDALATRAAHQLIAAYGVRKGDVVASLQDRNEWSVVALLAILKVGGVFLPVNPKLPVARIRDLLAVSQATVVVLHSNVGCCTWGAATPFVWIDQASSETDLEVPPLEPIAMEGDDAAYMIFTSGSTGEPKGVVIEHGGLLHTVLDHIERFGVEATDRYLQFMAVSFDGFLLDVFTALGSGATLVMAGDATIADPDKFMKLVEEEGVTMTTLTPSYLQLLDPSRVGRLRVLVSAGEVLGRALANRYVHRLQLYNGYGPTEATINTTLHRVQEGADDELVPIGSPSAGKRVWVLDPHGNVQPVGVVGELCIAGSGLARGYLGDRTLTADKFVRDPFGEGRLYRSGDYGAWTPDGELLFQGRRDGQVKVNGYRIDLGEVRAAMETHVGVAASHVVVRRSDGLHAELVAFYQVCGGDSVARTGARELRATIEAQVPAYMVPSRFVAVGCWPLTSHGKIDETKLLEGLADSALEAPLELGPSTPLEHSLCELWGEVLRRPVRSVEAGFFSLGGDSIRVIQVVHLAKTRGLPMEARDLRAYQTVRELAAHLEGRIRVRAAPISGEVPVATEQSPLTEHDKVDFGEGLADVYPAARMQILMIDEYAEDRHGNGIYLGCAEWRFRDPSLSEEAVLVATDQLVRANRSLRTTFARSPSGRVLQQIHHARPFHIPRTDLRGRSRGEIDAFFPELTALKAQSRFDPFSNEGLVRFELFRTCEDECSIFLSFHHAILDGWSGVELRNAWLGYYEQAKLQQPVVRAIPGDDPYKEFVSLELEALNSAEARDYWCQQVCGEPHAARIDGIRSLLCGSGRSPAHAEAVEHELPEWVVRRAIECGRAENVSLRSVFLWAVTGALMTTLETSFMGLCLVTNGRSEKLSAPFRATGLFWNIVPYVVGQSEAWTPVKVQAKLHELDGAAAFPFHEIQQLAARPLRLPLFNFVNFHNADEGAERLFEGVVQSRFHFPLTCFVKLAQGGRRPTATVRLGYDRSCLDHNVVASLAESIESHLRGARDGLGGADFELSPGERV